MGTIATLYCSFGPPEILGESAELSAEDFSRGPIVIGRSPEVAIPLSDEEVSRMHCSLVYTGDGFTLTDENSTNGTTINGEKLEPNRPYRLRHEDEIQVGHISFIFSLAEPEANRGAEQEMALQLLQSYGWQVLDSKGLRYWVVPAMQSLQSVPADARSSIEQAFESSARIGLHLAEHAGKRAIMEKYLVARPSQGSYEAYVLFLNGRIIGAYAVNPAEESRLIPLNEGSTGLNNHPFLSKQQYL